MLWVLKQSKGLKDNYVLSPIYVWLLHMYVDRSLWCKLCDLNVKHTW